MNSSLSVWPPENTVQRVSMFFIDLGESGRHVYFSMHAFIFFVILFLCLYAWLVEKPGSETIKYHRFKKIVLSDWMFASILFAFILMARVPLATSGILNPDEPYWVAEAKALLHDPRPWLSIDTGTGGPLVPLTLLTLKIFNFSIDQGSIKLLAGAIVGLSVICVYMSLTLVMRTALCRLMILPLVIAFSIMKSGDLTAYNSEHPVILILCIALLFFSRLYVSGPGPYLVNLILLGFLLGLVPFAKLQGVPIAFFLGIVSCGVVINKLSAKGLFVLISSALAPTLLMLLTLWSYGGLSDFWISYFQYNVSYASEAAIQESGLIPRIKLFFDLIHKANDLYFFIYFSLGVLLAGGTLLLFSLKNIPKRDLQQIIFSLALIAISIFSIIAPARPFLHYILFLLIPLTILSAVTLKIGLQHVIKNTNKSLLPIMIKTTIILIFFTGMSLYYFKNISTSKIDYLRNAREYYDGYAPQGLVGAVLEHYFTLGTRIAVWEYEPELFEGTDFLLGTRDVATAFHLQKGLSDYYVSRYLRDLIANKPSLFVVSTSRSTHGIDKYPKIESYINRNYTPDALVDGYKIYVRNDELAKERGWIASDFKKGESTSEFHSDLQILTQNGSFIYFRGWTVFKENVIDQRVFLVLKSERETLFVPCHQIANSGVVDFSGKKNYLMCGFLGFIPIAQIPKGEYQIWLQVENHHDIGLKQIDRTLDSDTFIEILHVK